MIHTIQALKLAQDVTEARRRPFLAQPLTSASPIYRKRAQKLRLCYYLSRACMSHHTLQKTKHTDNTCNRIFRGIGHFRFRKKPQQHTQQNTFS